MPIVIYTYLICYTLSADNGACLIRSEIASVSVQEEDFGTFVYLDGENDDTTWPSKYFKSEMCILDLKQLNFFPPR